MNTRSLPRMRGQSPLDIDARRIKGGMSASRNRHEKPFQTEASGWQPIWLADMLTPDKNSFGVLRLAMALAVLVSHAIYLTVGDVKLEPLYQLTGYTLGQHGVQVFFILSGILVAQSLFQSRSVKDYAIARALRIFPALAVCVLLTAMVLGPLLSELSAATYMQGKWTASYILKTLSLSTGEATLPGLFVNNVVPHKVNTSIWTLKYEVACYALLALVGMVLLRVQAWRQSAVLIGGLWLILAVGVPSGISASQGDRSALQVLHYFTIFFGTGVLAYALRDYIPVHALLLVPLGAVFWLAIGTRYAVPAMALFLGYASLWLATFRFGSLRDFTNRNDYSYATYLYHYPVAQGLLHVAPDMHVVPLIGLTAGIVLTLAFLSWETIERPALALRKRFQRGGEPIAVAPIAAAPKPSVAAAATAPAVTPAPSVAKSALSPAMRSAPTSPRKPPVATAQPEQAVPASTQAAPEPQPTGPLDAPRVWRPMPTRRAISVMPESQVISGAVISGTSERTDEPVAPKQALRPASERVMAPRRKEPVTTVSPQPNEPAALAAVISTSRMAMATQRPKVPAAPTREEPTPAPTEPSRAVVVIGPEPPASRRAATPRPTWQKPFDARVPV